MPLARNCQLQMQQLLVLKSQACLTVLCLFLLQVVASPVASAAEATQSSTTKIVDGKLPEFRFNPHVPMLPSVVEDREDPWLWLDNSQVKVGVHLGYGGSICWISESGSDFNLVNWYDPGRQIQCSYFANDGYPQKVYGGPGPEGKNRFAVWNWNPVQAGDVRGNRSPVLGFRQDENHVWTRCQPLNWGGMASAVSLQGKWDPGPCPAEAFIDMHVELDGKMIKVTFGFLYWGEESHDRCNFEMPAVYVTAPLDQYWTYTGDQPWTGAPAENMTEKVPLDMTREQFKHANPERWGAWLTQEGFGLTIYQPDANRLTAGTYYPHGKPEIDGKPRDDHWGRVNENHYLAGWAKHPIDRWHCRYEWDLYLIVGDLTESRKLIADKLRNAPILRSSQQRQEGR